MSEDPGTWTELKASLADWLNRSDLTAKIPEFIALAERRFNRIIVHPDREKTTTSTTSSERLGVPADMWQLRSIYLATDPRQQLEQVSPAVLRTEYADQRTGKPRAFAIQDGQFIFGPAPDASYTIEIAYVASIDPLNSGTASNWLLEKHPDIYIYGSLLAAEAYLWNDARLGVWKNALDEAIVELTDAGNRYRYSASPMRLRSPVVGWNI
jgi:hypothetical protein